MRSLLLCLLLCTSLALTTQPLSAAPVVSAGKEAQPRITAPPGFVVESILKVPGNTMGSWASLTIDDRGRLIASDEGNKGLYRITPAHKPNYQSGRNLFHATQCAKCHRLGGEGGAVGPDLSTAMKKYSVADMLDSVFQPSKVISDQYGSHRMMTTDGRVLSGRVVEIGSQYYVYTVDGGSRPEIVRRDDVDEMVVSKVSQMPLGLFDTLNARELNDLITYLQAAGKPKDLCYQTK